MYSPWYCFITSKKVFCMKTTSVERLLAQADAYLATSASSCVARHDAVDEAELGHLVGGEGPAGEDHLLELAQAHGLGPPPHAGRRPGVAEGGVAEQRVVGGDHEVGVAGLVEVPAVAVALHLDDGDLLELLERAAAAARVGEPGLRGRWRRGGSCAGAGRSRRRPRARTRGSRPSSEFTASMNSGRSCPVPKSSPVAADDEHLHVVVDVGLVQQVGVAQPHARSSAALSCSGRFSVIVAILVAGSFS